MTLLELITEATARIDPLTSHSDYPIILDGEKPLLSLKPESKDTNSSSLIKPVEGWQVSQTDSLLLTSSQKFYKKLKRKLKNPTTFTNDEFIALFNSFLEKASREIGLSVAMDQSRFGYTRALVEKLGFLLSRNVMGLILEACIVLENWGLLETLIVYQLVDHSASSKLVFDLVERRKSDLICLSVKHLPDLQSSEVTAILKYFLDPPSDAYSNMGSVRKEWESQALSAVDMASNKSLSGLKLRLAKEASIQLMVAHDEFTDSELCLHYLLSSSNLDENFLSPSINKLNGSEILSLIRYLSKWLKKYETFPQVGLCPGASSMLGFSACNWVPTIEDVVKCVGLVLDEHFSSLVLNSEFHEELRSIEGMIKSLALEAQLCCSLANVVENLRNEGRCA